MKKLVPSIVVAGLIIGFSLAPLACSGTIINCQDPKNAGSVKCTTVNAVVDCTGISSLSSAVTELGPVFAGIIQSATSSGGINWGTITGQLEGLASAWGMCIFAQIWSDYFGAGAKPAELTSDIKAHFDEIRAKVAPGTAFKVKGGVL